jgi:hypothetical protein
MSLSRDFAAFVANLRFEDLPPPVADRVKGVTLQALTPLWLHTICQPAGRPWR